MLKWNGKISNDNILNFCNINDFIFHMGVWSGEVRRWWQDFLHDANILKVEKKTIQIETAQGNSLNSYLVFLYPVLIMASNNKVRHWYLLTSVDLCKTGRDFCFKNLIYFRQKVKQPQNLTASICLFRITLNFPFFSTKKFSVNQLDHVTSKAKFCWRLSVSWYSGIKSNTLSSFDLCSSLV